MDENTAESFGLFRPFCAGLASKPCQANLDKLSCLVFKSDRNTLESLQEYLLFPCQLYLRTPVLPENYTLSVIDFVGSFFSHPKQDPVQLNSTFILLDILQCLMKLGMEKPSEDMKLGICKCLTSMFRNSSPEVRDCFYQKEQKLAASHLVFSLLEWSSEEVTSLTSSSFELLLEICPNTETSNSFVRQFAQMLPGITTKLVNLLLTKNHGLRTMRGAIPIWAKFVTLIFNDANVQKYENSFPDLEVISDESGTIGLFSDSKTSQAAKDHLFNHISVFGQLIFNSKDHSIRKDYLEVCFMLVENCARHALVGCRKLLLEHLSSLTMDQNCEKRAKLALRKLLTIIKEDQPVSMESNFDSPLQEVAEQAQVGVFELCEKCSKKVDGSTLYKLLGYLSLLKEVEEFTLFFQSETYLGKLMETILKLSELEEPDICPFYVGEIESLDQVDFLFSNETDLGSSSIKFRYEVIQEYSTEYFLILHTLAKYSNLHLIVDFLIEKLNAAQISEAVNIIFLINEVVKGACNSEESLDPHDVKHVLEKLIETYLSIEENLCIKHGSGGARCPMIGLRVTEGFGIIFSTLKKVQPENSFGENYLGYTLSRILVSFDGLQPWAANVLVGSLEKIKSACGYENIAIMFSNHFSWLCCDLSLQLRRNLTVNRASTYRPSGLKFFLVVVLKLNNILTDGRSISSQSDLSEIMLVLLNHLDITWMHPDKSLTLDILRIIALFVESLKLATVKEEDKNFESSKTNETGEGSLTTLIKGLKEVDSMMEADDNDFEQCPDDGFHNEAKIDEDNEKMQEQEEVSENQIHFLQKCVEHCRHFISMVACPMWQVTALDVVTLAIQSFKVDRDTLLPLIHQSWQPLKLLFESDNINVVAKAFSALHIMAKLGKDFIHRRTVNDVLPSIMKYIEKLKAMVADKRYHSTRISKKSWKLFEQMTKGLWEFMALLELSEFEVDPIIENMIEFVEIVKSRQSFQYQLSLEPQTQMNADILWLKLEAIDRRIC